MSPESMRQSVYYKESDVYSFAIVMYEVFAERDAFPFSGYKLINAIVSDNYRPSLDELAVSAEIKTLIQECWKDDWKHRCSFEEICKVLAREKQILTLQKNAISL